MWTLSRKAGISKKYCCRASLVYFTERSRKRKRSVKSVLKDCIVSCWNELSPLQGVDCQFHWNPQLRRLSTRLLWMCAAGNHSRWSHRKMQKISNWTNQLWFFKPPYIIQDSSVRGCGGIGRRARFKIWYLWCVGSSPTTRTKLLKTQLSPFCDPRHARQRLMFQTLTIVLFYRNVCFFSVLKLS